MKTRLIHLLSVVALTLLMAACSTVPYTGRTQFCLTTTGEEKSLGAEAYDEILSSAKISNDVAMNAALQRVAKPVIQVVDAENNTGFDWEFKVIDSNVANAFCLPGGKIAVYTGLFPYVANDAELATVVSHEIAHALARHSGEDISHNLAFALGGFLVQAFTGSDELLTLYSLGGQLGVRLPFSRSQESEADYIGQMVMAKAGYDPRAALPFWKKFGNSDESWVGNFFSTHPMSSDRISAFEKNMPEALKLYEKSPKLGYGQTYSGTLASGTSTSSSTSAASSAKTLQSSTRTVTPVTTTTTKAATTTKVTNTATSAKSTTTKPAAQPKSTTVKNQPAPKAETTNKTKSTKTKPKKK